MKRYLPDGQRGMTLIEILLVITITAILSSTGISSWQNYRQRAVLEQSSAGLLAFLTRVQASANWRNQTYLLQVGKQGTRGCVAANQTKREGECDSDSGLRFVLPESLLDLEVSHSDIGFGFYGIRNTAGTGHIVVSNPAGRVRVILSAKGRLRRCSESINGQQPYLPGIAAC
ncbi:prepilin-type N-terminal cleavage/methylation domain-containing protein [Budviciaceae bacterium BWR-B9]|uniref:Prepilin-type N-terminal cleavage/methylation domain-containing protein n=1 Tax=Limnobaculum allomyrinae TaxID=2791986 RepID=A0ABS1ISE8_9GAMM|nr:MULTISPECIES: prepilin-type N-terminal cleavage/methylation domain-containing protein [Limnobaculum]MBK5144602.1 prepilin-type N-terminal cleavage/methylation domain-containing protein [Limnobaculum allomyrinae]MBV7692167.1 prepilin-type N-terminal cleavage/methylation domain-containing protein [Limnobaculum sp. M2-1]